MNKYQRGFGALILIVISFITFYFLKGAFVFESTDIWFSLGIIGLITGIFFIEHFFTRPTDVLVNSLIVGLALLSIPQSKFNIAWYILFVLIIGLFLLSLYLLFQPIPNKYETEPNKTKHFFFLLLTNLGKASVIYSAVLILSVITFEELADSKFYILLLWALILIIKDLPWHLFKKGRDLEGVRTVGEVTKIIHPNIVRFRIFDTESCSKNSFVVLTKRGLYEDDSPIAYVIGYRNSPNYVEAEAIFIDKTIDEDKIDKRVVVSKVNTDKSEKINKRLENNELYKNIDNILGIVRKETNISTLKFEITNHSLDIEQGNLVSVSKGNRKILYQVVQGWLNEEPTIEKNERMFTTGTAEQLGEWMSDSVSFRTYNWLPQENSVVSLSLSRNIKLETIDIASLNPKHDDYWNHSIGTVPNSNYPVNLNLKNVALYHTAILGVTGSGKSYLVYQLIEAFIKRKVKIISLDVTGDHKSLLMSNIIPWKGKAEEYKNFLNDEKELYSSIEFDKTFREGKSVIEVTYDICDLVLNWCKKYRNNEEITNILPKVIIVMEEAHNLVPEIMSFKDDDRTTVIKTSQILMQARKYGLGFIIISQRTASITKNVLNQCNTLFAFKAYDQTGFDFMKNYLGENMVQSVPTLKNQQCILVGKGSCSDRPLISSISTTERVAKGDNNEVSENNETHKKTSKIKSHFPQ